MRPHGSFFSKKLVLFNLFSPEALYRVKQKLIIGNPGLGLGSFARLHGSFFYFRSILFNLFLLEALYTVKQSTELVPCDHIRIYTEDSLLRT